MSIKHIVVADDDEDDFLFFKSAFEKVSKSIGVFYTPTGSDLELYLKKAPLPDIVFLDLNMPVMTGLDCLKLIRADKRFGNMPIIIYSTSSAKRDIDESYKLGANRYIIKPNSYEDIKKIAQSIFKMGIPLLMTKQNILNFTIN